MYASYQKRTAKLVIQNVCFLSKNMSLIRLEQTLFVQLTQIPFMRARHQKAKIKDAKKIILGILPQMYMLAYPYASNVMLSAPSL